MSRDPRLRAFVRIDKLGRVVPGSLILRRKPPENGTTHHWIEIEANVCCGPLLSTFDFSDNSLLGLFTLTVNGTKIVNSTGTTSGTFTAAAGQTVVATVSGTNPFNTLFIVDANTGAIVTNQSGAAPLTFTYIPAANNAYAVVATSGPTTTTSTTTTTTTHSTTTTTTTTI